MKPPTHLTRRLCAAVATLLLTAMSHAADTNAPAPAAPDKLPSTICDWEKLQPVAAPNGIRRAVFEGPTVELDKLHCHITTLNPGADSGPPRLHLHEEVIIIKEGLIEATCDGRKQTVGPGSVIFFAAHATTSLRNAGSTPATYTVVYYFTPLTPRS
jgi:mannose-6-phosphate isomerase-like protein (cupin superfamily)